MRTLPVAEIFGPTWQGEGRHAGLRCGFLRLGLCNLSCEWCDTPYTWDHSRYDVAAECPPMAPGEIREQVGKLDVDTMVLTGGEPLIHARSGPCALSEALSREHLWHLETNGTLIPPGWAVNRISYAAVSPKLNTRDSERLRLIPEALTWWAQAAWDSWADFKFVAERETDLELADGLVKKYDIPRERVWIMPEGSERDPLLRRHQELAPAIADRGYNTSTRLQVLLWGNERGR